MQKLTTTKIIESGETQVRVTIDGVPVWVPYALGREDRSVPGVGVAVDIYEDGSQRVAVRAAIPPAPASR